MSTIEVKGVTIGDGKPKICVPIVGRTQTEILNECKALTLLPIDMIEWRMDYYIDIFKEELPMDCLKKLREHLPHTPLIATFRTKKEGGEVACSLLEYCTLIEKIIKTGAADFVDVELFTGDETVTSMIDLASRHNVRVILSNHDFFKTPPKEEMEKRITKMYSLGADLPKLAVMPNSPKDVLSLLEVTEKMKREHEGRPLVTMSMGGMGVISRLTGETFGSSVTFACANRPSAPGQIDVSSMDTILDILHKSN